MAEDVEIERVELMNQFQPENLYENLAVFERALQQYHKVYEEAKITPKHYKNVNHFVKEYLS